MGIVAWLKSLFEDRPVPVCPGCSGLILASRAKDDTIDNLRDEVRYLREEREQLQHLFNRAVRLEASQVGKAERSGVEPSKNQSPATSWPKIRRELEKKNRKDKSPEDQVHDYWTQKAKEMENASGIGEAVSVHGGDSTRNETHEGDRTVA